MHKINYKWGTFDFIDSERVPELFEKMQKKQVVMVGENIRDTFDIKNVVKLNDEEEMIQELLKDTPPFVYRKVEEEIKFYTKRLTPGVVKNMIKHYEN